VLTASPPAAASEAGEAAPTVAGVGDALATHTAYLAFTPEALRRLKADAEASLPGGTDAAGWLSTNDAVTALLWRAATRARGFKPSDTQLSACMFAADCRARMDPPLKPGYFGNVNFVGFPRAEVGALAAESLGSSALRVRKGTEARTDAYVRSVLALWESASDIKHVGFNADNVSGADYIVTNWSKFGHGIDFGLGTPIAFRTGPAALDGMSILMPRPDGGIDACTGMHEPYWSRMLADDELLRYVALPRK